jgi:hypothetical protein
MVRAGEEVDERPELYAYSEETRFCAWQHCGFSAQRACPERHPRADGGRKLAKLLRELKAGRGMPEIVNLQMNGYTETLGGLDIASLTYEDLAREAAGNFDHVGGSK